MAKALLIDPSDYPLDRPVAGLEQIRAFNQQRFEFEMLQSVLYMDDDFVVGLLANPTDAWWARGHVPDRPLMPAVLMLEGAAQLGSFHGHAHLGIKKGQMIAFGGLDRARFRGIVEPGCDLLVAGKLLQFNARRGILKYQAQMIAGERLVADAEFMGVVLPEAQ